MFPQNLLFLLRYRIFAQWCSYHGFKTPIALGRWNYIHADKSSCIMSLSRPAQQQSSLTAIRKSGMFITNSDRHTTEKIQRWTQLLPKLSSFLFPVQDRNPVCSVLLSLTSSISSFKCYPCWCCSSITYPFGEDQSHLNLNNMEVYDAYRASLESKAPQSAEPCRIRRVRNKLALRKPWLNLRVRVVCCFL